MCATDVKHLVVADDVDNTVNYNLLSLFGQNDVLDSLRIGNDASLAIRQLNCSIANFLQTTSNLYCTAGTDRCRYLSEIYRETIFCICVIRKGEFLTLNAFLPAIRICIQSETGNDIDSVRHSINFQSQTSLNSLSNRYGQGIDLRSYQELYCSALSQLHTFRVIIQDFHFMLFTSAASAQTRDSIKVFTEEHPLVYEDAWDLWPYVFLNENGEPDGYNIDLLKMIFKRLNIPYIVKLKPTLEAQEDLKNGKSDLMLRMDASFSRGNSLYSNTIIQLFTHSVVSPQSSNVVLRTGKDLKGHQVIVHEGSFSHHMIMDEGWTKDIKAYDDMKEAIQKLRTDEQGVIIWNTMSLKWLMRKYKTDNLVISPIDIPAGEYKFMSKNRHLLNQIDSVYTELRVDEQLEAIRNKWFYPEHADTGIPAWVWNIAAVLAALALIFLAYYTFYRIREHQMTREIRQSNDRLSLVLSTSEIGLWVYHVLTQTTDFLDEFGKIQQTLHIHELVSRYSQNDYDVLRETIADIIHQRKESAHITLKTRINKNNHFIERDYSVDIGVLRRDRFGKPTDILGTRVDITNERMRHLRIQDSMMRYQAIFNSAMIDMVVYDADGYIIDMNDKALNGLHMNRKDLIREHIHLKSVLGVENINLDTLEPIHITQIFPSNDERSLPQHLHRSQMFYELKLVPVRDSQGKLLNIFGTGRDVTEVAMSYHQIKQNARELQRSNDEINHYIRNIDYVMNVGGIRMARYNPDTHTLTIYNDTNNVQFTLTQTRALTFADESSRRRALNIIKSMDGLTTKPIHADIKTTLRKQGGGGRLYLQLHFIPMYDDRGGVKEYFGMCRDISEIKTIEEKLAAETLRAQEVEVVKNAFLHNMSFEIRTPLNTVVGFAELFQMEHSQEDEVVFIQEIKENSAKLLKLINDILFISRLDAEMIEFKTRPTDFSKVIIQQCESVWANIKKAGVDYTVISPFSKLMLDIDSSNVGIIIDKIVTNAVQYTDKGSVKVRYDYLGDGLIVSVEDTGCGIPDSALGSIFDRFVTGASNSAGLGLSICNELIKRLNGTINIKSDEGKGTIVWFTIPCKALEIERT